MFSFYIKSKNLKATRIYFILLISSNITILPSSITLSEKSFLFLSFYSLPSFRLHKFQENDSKNRKAPQAPRTAPITTTTHFPFDTPTSPKSVRSFEKNQSLFTFNKDSCAYQQPSTATTTIIQRGGVKVFKNGCTRDEEKENEKRWEQSKFMSRKHNDVRVDETEIDDCKMEKKDISLKSRNRFLNSIKNLSNKEKYGSNSKINSAPAVTGSVTKRDSDYDPSPDTTMFPFDREAIDYERIQRECFAVEEDPDGFPYCFDTDSSVIDTDSPAYEKPYFDSPSKSYQKIKMDKYTGYPSNSDIYHQYNMISQQESMLSYEKDKRKSNKFDKRKSDAFTPKPNTDPMIKSVCTLLKQLQSPNFHFVKYLFVGVFFTLWSDLYKNHYLNTKELTTTKKCFINYRFTEN